MAKKTDKEDLRLQKEYEKAIGESNLSAKERIDLLSDINKMSSRQIVLAMEQLDIAKQIVAEEKKQAKIKSDKEKAEARLQKLRDDAVKKEKELTDQNIKLIDITSDLQNVLQGNITKYKGIGKETSLIVQDLNKKIIAEVKSGKMNAHQAKVLMTQNAEASKLARAVDTIASNENMAHVFDETMTQIDTLTDKIERAFTNIPGGGALFKIIGGDQLNAQLKEGAVNGMAAMTKAMQAGKTPLQALNMGFKAFNATVMLNPVVLVIAAVVALAVIVKKLVNAYGEFEKLARDSAEQMGITVTQGKEMVKNAQDASTAFGVQLVNAKEVLDVQKQITEATGNSSMISADVAANVADTGKAFGYGVKAAGELQGVFQNMGMASEDAAKMQMTLAKETLVQGVNTGKVIADINANAAKTNKFFRGDIKALTAAAVQANKMGISIADMAKTAESLLDFESSINAQMEFQALTGKEMNLDLARQLAFQGDIAGATKEVMNNIGSLAEFNEMLPHQQEAFAKAAGMSVDQISKGLAIQEAMPNATEEQRKAMESMGLTAADIANMSEEDLKKRLADEQAALKQEMAMENMKAQMMQALLPIGEAFSKIFAALTPILKVIAGLFKIIGFAIELILTPLEFVYSLFRESEAAIGGIFGGIMDIFSGDIAGGFAKIGQGIVRMILMPFQAIIDMARGIINFLIDGINLIPGVDIPLIPAFNLADSIMGLEEGGTVSTGGAFVVGEAGPEVVNLNAGDAVTPNDQLTGAAGAAGADGASGTNSQMPSAAEIGAAVAKALTGMKFNTPPIQIGNEVIGAISAESDIQRSYKK
jgi:hypothetical protein